MKWTDAMWCQSELAREVKRNEAAVTLLRLWKHTKDHGKFIGRTVETVTQIVTRLDLEKANKQPVKYH